MKIFFTLDVLFCWTERDLMSIINESLNEQMKCEYLTCNLV